MPVHSPRLQVIGLPDWNTPSVVSVGGDAGTGIGASLSKRSERLTASSLVAASKAISRQRIRAESNSSAVGIVKLAPVAPSIANHASSPSTVTLRGARSHRYCRLIGSGVQAPGWQVRVLPSFGTPDRVGRAVFRGPLGIGRLGGRRW